jgi:NAD+ kinase
MSKAATTRTTPIRRIAVVAKTGPGEGPRIAAELGHWLEERQIDVTFDTKTATAVGRLGGVPRNELPVDVDLVIVAGGDGTLLSVARSAAPLGIPILGINLGSLGFLTELQPEEMFDGLTAVLDGQYRIDERQTLRVRHVHQDRVQQEYAVLNDAVIGKSALARMITIELRVDREEVATYTADGLIISSPTGSTAYSLSAGGPILDPRMMAFVVAPICPHTMTYRPLVVPGDVTLEALLRSTGEAVYLTLDGQIGIPLESDESIAVDRHPNPVRLVRVVGHGFFEVLRRKLHWGERQPE